MLALDQRDHVTAEQHLHLCVAILEELVLRDLRLVSKHVHLAASNESPLAPFNFKIRIATYQNVDDRLEELEVVQVHRIPVHSVGEQMVTDRTRRSKHRVV